MERVPTETDEDPIELPDSENPIADARKVLREAFASDPEWKKTYIANMRMYIYDHLDSEMFGLLEPMLRHRDEKILEGILDLIFRE